MTENQVKASAIDHYNKGWAHGLGQYNAAITECSTTIRFKLKLIETYINR